MSLFVAQRLVANLILLLWENVDFVVLSLVFSFWL
jgi:hypothetical protein